MNHPAFAKIIFLDIDGVLNSDLWNAAHQSELRVGILIDSGKVDLLAGLVQKTGSRIVLHSGWRFWFNINLKALTQEAACLLELFHAKNLELYDITPDFSTEEIKRTKKFSLVKAQEISAWLEAHPKTGSWVVIDDLDLHNDKIRRRQVKPDPAVGLTQQDIKQAEIMLSDP